MSIILYSLCAADRRRHYSPHVWKIIMALKHKELQAEVRPVSFAEIAGIEDGSYKSVPVLNDNGHIEGDSFEIAVHLERAYPDRPSLFGGPGGQAMARFVESFSQTVIHPPVSAIAAMDMHALMSPADQAYFRAAREKRFGKTLEEASATRHIELAALPEKFAPLRSVLAKQPWLGGAQPLFADYILFGVLQWARITVPYPLLPADDPVSTWFERCLDLHGAIGRSVVLSD
ncbi:glutathione S-transferase family protein [Janthinobacterium lividum]|jgi:glutathione S-transferase|uniref:Glutathione S-transferase family protein n=1 Tax=Janthinobacterium lividum TaxID=29581 RepID=A0ABU0XP99_9BURK|nr:MULTISPECIES: glutathione S-transferase family protein [Janthinobacterium]KHA77895.1 beta-aryl ether-cleaving protein [Janthinobacterium lividum]MCC7696742.1 glutathione S-transferase family protein [Janthinobacterium sp. EB271-G4-7A]MCC7712183.1 glutathione S-transferase family protein [Janthinobacterium lividum]MDO8033927.1 glutathione S-transferase family protein [Janthinobacterium sp. SUN128]MDQ4625343.1 glutathione S-transferase family protein [Janthinobacterium lividum]